MELFIEVNGKDRKDMVLEYKYGQMGRNMKENGGEIKPMARESSGM